MSRVVLLALFLFAVFLQAGTYGLTFLLPDLFATFDADERDVGLMLSITALVTLITVYFSGHLSDALGRMRTLGLSGFTITGALFLYAEAQEIGPSLVLASALIGFGWGLMYTLAPVVLTRLSGEGNRVQVFSLYSVFLMAGFGISPVYTSWLEAWGFGLRDTFRMVGVFCTVSGIIFLTLRQAMAHHAVAEAAGTRSRLSLKAITAIMRSRGWLPIIMVCLGASVFAGVNNFQTVIAKEEGLKYADYFLVYTGTTVLCRIALAGWRGGKTPYLMIGLLQLVMSASALSFLFIGGSQSVYMLCAILFAIGYGASYPILAAMAANDAQNGLVAQTVQLFSLTYFIGIFGFPYVAGLLLVEHGIPVMLVVVAALAAIEATMALQRYRGDRRNQ